MSFVAAAVIGGAVIGAVASNKAAKKGAAASRYAADLSLTAEQQAREDQLPWLEAGEKALKQQEDFISGSSYQTYLDSLDPDKFKNTDYYKFLNEEGTRARDRSASSRGMLLSGGQQRALTSFGQGLASTEYGNYFERQRALRTGRANELASVAGTGQQTAANLGALGANTAARAGDAYQNAGQLEGAGYIGVGNSANNAINQWFKYKGTQNGTS